LLPIAGLVEGADASQIKGYGAAQLKAPLDHAVFNAPEQRCAQVVLVEVQPIHPAGMLRPRQLGCGALAEFGEVVGVCSPNSIGVSAGDQLFQRKLADCLQQAESGLAGTPSRRWSKLLSASAPM
jgi:hypothetical protein